MELDTGQYKPTFNDVDEMLHTGLCLAMGMIYTIIRHFQPRFDIFVIFPSIRIEFG